VSEGVILPPRKLLKLTRDDARSALVEFVLNMDRAVGFASQEEAVLGMLQAASVLAHKTGWTEAKFKGAARRCLRDAIRASDLTLRRPALLVPGTDTAH